MNYVDTHCHLDFHQYDLDRDLVIKEAWEVGLIRILVPGIDIPTSQAAVKLAEQHSGIYAAIGIHPNSSYSWDQRAEEALELLSSLNKVVAIGEIGLDYYRDRAPKEIQKIVFQHQLRLANRRELPVVIHTRNKHPGDRSCIADIIDILSMWEPCRQSPGVVHSYSGNIEEAQQLISMGYFLGITGPVTYKNAETLRMVVAAVPLENILIETDGPFLSPQQKRGQRNVPSYVRFVADKIAEIRDLPLEVVISQVRRNAAQLFQWEEIV